MSSTEHNFAKKLAPRGHVEIMEHAGFKARLMMAERIIGEGVHALPPGTPVPVYPIAALPAAPDSWSRDAGTYVCPVSSEVGLWFDWTMNDNLNTAILPSVKGMNPITGQKINTIDLEQYKDKCPIHGCDLSHERYCEECGYKLPPQNYVSTGYLWWDGFRQTDGSVRQFFFTGDEERDVASAVIGKENTVPAFGFAFFKPKVPRVREREELTRGGIALNDSYPPVGASSNFSQPMFFSPCHTADSPNSWKFTATEPVITMSSTPRMKSNEDFEARDILRNKSVSVGAGAKIRQELEQDTLDIKDWNEEPSGIIRLYFVFKPQFTKMLREGGIKDVVGNDVGFLKNVPVG